jgi:hypothetical protein
VGARHGWLLVDPRRRGSTPAAAAA